MNGFDNDHQERRRDWAALAIAAFLAVVAGVMLWDSARLADLGGSLLPILIAIPVLIGAGALLMRKQEA